MFICCHWCMPLITSNTEMKMFYYPILRSSTLYFILSLLFTANTITQITMPCQCLILDKLLIILKIFSRVNFCVLCGMEFAESAGVFDGGKREENRRWQVKVIDLWLLASITLSSSSSSLVLLLSNEVVYSHCSGIYMRMWLKTFQFVFEIVHNNNNNYRVVEKFCYNFVVAVGFFFFRWMSVCLAWSIVSESAQKPYCSMFGLTFFE